jgi:Cu/Ag efflux protein CusF
MKSCQLLGILLFSATFILAGCGGGRQKASEEPDYPIKGKVLAVNPDKPSVTLDHEDIPGLMKGMQMEFAVDDAKLLEGIKVGDQIQGRLKKSESGYSITRLEKQ